MPYTDVPAHEWYARAAETATALGLLNGYPDGTFRPDAPVTRAELAAIITRLANNDLALRRWASLRLREQAAPAVVHIRAGGAVGAGVMVHPAGYIVTCHHVIAARQPGQVLECTWPEWEPGQQAFPDLQVVAEAPAVDLALCRVQWPAMEQAQGFPWLRLAASEAEPSEPVVMLGSPAGFAGWESYGLIARPEAVIQAYRAPQDVLCISGAISPGNSGGALVRASDGTLLGITSAKLVHIAVEGMAFAVPMGRVAELMASAEVRQP